MSQVAACRGALADMSGTRGNTNLTRHKSVERHIVAAVDDVTKAYKPHEHKSQNGLGNSYKTETSHVEVSTVDTHQSIALKPLKAELPHFARGANFADEVLPYFPRNNPAQRNGGKAVSTNKQLPLMPKLRNFEVLGKRRLFDGTNFPARNFNKENIPTPPTKTKAPVSTTPSSDESFKVTTSLSTHSESDSEVETGVAKAVKVHKVRASTVHTHGSSAAGSTAIYSLATPRRIIFRPLPPGRVTTHKNGSPMQREKVYNPHAVRGQDALSKKGLSRAREAIIRNAEEKLLEGRANMATKAAEGSSFMSVDETMILDEDCPFAGGDEATVVDQDNSSLDFDDATVVGHDSDDRAEGSDGERQDSCIRRSTRYGIGATFRIAEDADEIIMGTVKSRPESSQGSSLPALQCGNKSREVLVPLNSRTSNQSSLRNRFLSSHSLSAPTIVSSRSNESLDRVEAIKNAAVPFAARKSSLPQSSNSVPLSSSPSPSVADRLSRPTKASQARASESRHYLMGRGKSVGKKSSPLAPSTKRVTLNTPLNPSISTSSVRHATKGLKSRFSAMLSGRHRSLVPSASEPALNARSRETNKTTSHMMPGVGKIRMNSDFDGRGRKVHEDTTFRAEAQGHFEDGNNHLSGQKRAQLPTPTVPIADSSSQLYEGSNSTGDLQSGLSVELDVLLREAEQHLESVVRIAENTADPATRQAIRAILKPMADAIGATRRAQIGVIGLHKAIVNLANYTVSVAAATVGVSTVASTGNIPTTTTHQN